MGEPEKGMRMRGEFTLAMHRESEEFERSLIDQRVEQAFEQVYEALIPATSELRHRLDKESWHLFEIVERAYLMALETAARSGIGSQAVRRGDVLRNRLATIPMAPPSPPVTPTIMSPTAEPDQVINVRPCG